MTIEVSAFRSVPEFAQGYVRDLRIRWALEELGQAYEAVLIDMEEKNGENYRAWQPFGQVPAYRDGEVEMFESGAILLYLAEKFGGLCPKELAGRARVMTWVIAALNSIEPLSWNLLFLSDEGADKLAAEARRAKIEATLGPRLGALDARLSRHEYLEGSFTVADIVMSTTLREMTRSGVLEPYPALGAYVQRCTARPAFARALAAQMKPFREADAAA